MDGTNLGQYFMCWLERKKIRIKNLLTISTPDEALYREIMYSLGYPNNKVNFLNLALITPFREISKLPNAQTIQKALLYRAGLSNDNTGLPDNFDPSLRMDEKVWNYKKIRPANYPERRIIGISRLLNHAKEAGLVSFFTARIKDAQFFRNPKKRLQKIMCFEGIGIQRKEEMFFNIILPFLMVLLDNEILSFANSMFENYPPLSNNAVLKTFKKSYPEIPIINAKHYFGALFMMKNHLNFRM